MSAINVIIETMSPAAPKPDMQRPTIRALMLGAAAQRTEPTSNVAIEPKKIVLGG
jgi:hypothetical protein